VAGLHVFTSGLSSQFLSFSGRSAQEGLGMRLKGGRQFLSFSGGEGRLTDPNLNPSVLRRRTIGPSKGPPMYVKIFF